jgi:hypothetical protein
MRHDIADAPGADDEHFTHNKILSKNKLKKRRRRRKKLVNGAGKPAAPEKSGAGRGAGEERLPAPCHGECG